MQTRESPTPTKASHPSAEEFAASLQHKLSLSNIPALDGIRALSVLMVLLFHMEVPFIPKTHGVMMFFVLSGFLITWLLLKEADQTGDVSLLRFYKRRFLRIFPAYYTFLALHVTAFVLTRDAPVPWAQYLSAFFYVSNYYDAIVLPQHMIVEHTWSLGVEEQFYLLWPFIFIWFRNHQLVRFLVWVITGVYVYRLILYFGFHINATYLHAAFDTRMDNLAIGCLVAVLLKRQALANFWFRVCSRAGAPLVTLALIATSISCWYRYGSSYKQYLGLTLDALLCTVLMVQLIYLSGSFPWRWINFPWLRYVGRISYSMYLYHGFGDTIAIKLLRALPFPLQVVGAVALTIAIGSASYYIIERPFLRLKEKMSPNRTHRNLQCREGGAVPDLSS